MPTVPPACPKCKGSMLVIVFAADFELLSEMEKMMPYFGYDRVVCPLCSGTGSLKAFEPLGEYPPPKRGQS